jgi:cobalt-zinc-cadmium efflux system outer membrane protein
MVRAALLLLLASTVTVHADDGRTPVTLAEAMAAVPQAPEAKVGGHEVIAAEANIEASTAWPSPSVHVATNRLTARVTAGASMPLPVFGTVGAAKRRATAEMEVVRAETRLALRDLRTRVAQAWIALARADGEVTTTAIAAQQAAELEVIAKGRLSAGVGADVDVTVAGAARARADVAVHAAEREEDAASAELAGLLGWDPKRPLRASGALVTGPSSQQLEALEQKLVTHPERTAALDRIAAAQATLEETRTARFPSLAVEGEVLVDDPTNEHKTDVMLGVSLELPIFARVGDRARAARALDAAQRARLAVTEATLGSSLVAAYRMWQATTERLQAIERDVLPAQERAAALASTAYREGARDLAFALQAERDLAAVRAERIAALADAAAAYSALQLAAGDEVGK